MMDLMLKRELGQLLAIALKIVSRVAEHASFWG
jgi:hypothetical protein